MRRLYTFVISHFSEKARWALDLAGIEYEEKYLLPGLHVLTTRRLAPKSSVPVLVDGERVVQGSSRIIDHAVERLGAAGLTPADPADAARARELERLADDAFGRGVQTIFYATLLEQRASVVELWSLHGPWWGSALLTLAFPIGRRRVRRMYRIEPDSIAAAKERFRRGIEEVDRSLGSRKYLFGDAPGRVDVTVASLLAPACAPANHVVPWQPLPAALAEFVARFAGSATFELVHRMYREHRGAPRAGRA
jgi:glutathione S-transferase